MRRTMNFGNIKAIHEYVCLPIGKQTASTEILSANSLKLLSRTSKIQIYITKKYKFLTNANPNDISTK
jgi:hypothetical protein